MTLAGAERLDDVALLETADPSSMLRQVASSAAQVREAARAAADASLDELAAGGRPRAIVVTGMGGSGIAGEVLAAVAGQGCPVQVTTVHDYRLPGWVGAADLVIAVSCSGATEETLSAAEEAVRRGCRLPLLFRFPQMRKHFLHDGVGERLDMDDHLRDGALLAQVLIERSPGRTQFPEDSLERLDVHFVFGSRKHYDLLNLLPD